MDAQFFRYKQAYENIIKEDRQEEVKYTLQKANSKKEAKEGDEIGAVIGELTEQKASYVSKIANEFLDIKDRKEKVDEELTGVKQKLKDIDNSYFKAEDMVINRILQTATLSIKFAKIAKETVEKVEETDLPKVKKAFEKIEALILPLLPELKDQLEAIKKETITIRDEAKGGTWRVPTVTKESIDGKEAFKKFWKFVKDTGRNLKEKIQSWTIGYDKKLNTIEDAIDDLADLV